ncbi:MFS transporter [Kribbella catacumbae]|uniref:MFS transporter n=1 Tax=Kribbella catacumbae TaxID=460086 RepID=UPI00058AE4BF|nr:MFS transporter [Kribbella catacumbae]
MRHRWLGTARGLPRVFWYLWSITLIGNIASFVLIFITFYLHSERGFDPAQIGLALALTGGGCVVGSIGGGVLADRWGRRRTAVGGYLISSAALAGAGLSGGLVSIMAFLVVMGAGTVAAGIASSAILSEVVPAEDRPRAYSINYWAINVGTSIAALLAPVAMKAGFAVIFVVDAIGFLILAVLMWRLVPETRVAPSVETVAPAGAVRTILRDRQFLLFVALFFGFQLIFKQSNAGLPLAVQRDGLDAQAYGWIYAINTLLIVVGQLFLPRLIQGHTYSRVLALGALLVGLGFGLTGVADVIWFYALTVAIWTLGEMAYFAVLDSSLAGMAPGSLRGRYFGFFTAASQTSRLVAPLLSGYLLQYHGQTLWIACLILGMALAASYLVTGRSREQRIAETTKSESVPV